jgi:hypothetical protein
MSGRRSLLLFALALTSACPEPVDEPAETGDTVDTVDTDPPDDSGIDTGDPVEFAFDVQHRASETIPTVAVVEWETTREVTSWVAFGPPGTLLWSTASQASAGRSHRAALAGLQEATDYEFQVVAELDGALVRSELFDFQTGLLPSGIPELDTVVLEPDALQDGYTVTVLLPTWDGYVYVVVIDGDGEIVWAWPSQGNVIRAALSHDRSSVVFGTMAFGDGGGPIPPGFTGGTVLRSVSLDGEEVVDIAVEGPLLDFALLDDGWYAILVREGREIDGVSFYGDRVLRVGPQGQLETVWSAFDTFEADPADYPGVEWLDWTHSNALDCDRDAGICYVTVKYLQAVVAFDSRSGETLWVLDKDATGFTTSDPLPLIDRPHSVAAVDGGILVHDQADPQAGYCSGMMVFELDESARTVARTWSYAPETCIANDYLGNSEPLPDGGRLMTTGCAGVLEVVSASGDLRRRQEAELGACLGYATPEASLY